MDEKNPRAVYDEYGRLMSVLPSTEPAKQGGDGYMAVNVLSVFFIVLGVACLIAGCSIASEHYRFDWLKFCGAVVVSMFCFGWAAVTRVCALYMREHDK